MKLISDIEKFEKFLSFVTRGNPNDATFKTQIVSEKRYASTHKNETYSIKEQLFWYKEIENFSLKSARKIIKNALQKNQHPDSTDIVNSILLLYTYNPKRKRGYIKALNEILNSIQKVSLTQYFIPKGKIAEDFSEIKFGSFRIGKFDTKKFEYRCKRATSNYYELYNNTLQNRFVIEREYVFVNIIVWQKISNKYKISKQSFADHLLIYFERLSRIHFDSFWTKFVEDQYLQIAFGTSYIEDKLFRRSLDSTSISIYSNIKTFDKKVGYVVPENLTINTIAFDYDFSKDLKKLQNRLKEEYSFNEFENYPIHSTIESYIKFNSKAYIKLQDLQINEAFLHFVISLDLLLGEKGSSVLSVSKRTAVLTYKKFKSSFQDQVKLVQRIYDARSKYVHTGKSVNPKLSESLISICKFILEILFQIQSNDKYKKDDGFKNWVAELDYVISSIIAGKILPAEELSNLGIEE